MHPRKALGQRSVRRAARADDVHAQCSGEPADRAADTAGADHQRRLAGKLQRRVGPLVEPPRPGIDRGAVQAAGEMQETGDDIFGDRQAGGIAARTGDGDVAAPQVAFHQVAGAGRTLMHPAELRPARAQVARKGKGDERHFGVGEQRVALCAAAMAGRVGGEEAFGGGRRPGVADLAVEPAAGLDQPDARADRRDPGAFVGRQPRDGDDGNRIRHEVGRLATRTGSGSTKPATA